MSSALASGAERVRSHLGLVASERLYAWPLAAGPGRSVVAYGAHRGAELVSKSYPDQSGARAYAAMRRLSAALAERPGALLAVPSALFYDPQQRLLAQRYVAGIPLDDLARRPWAGDSLRLVGRALAELHSLRVAAGPPLRLCDHMAGLARPHPAALGRYDEGLAGRAGRLLDALLNAEAKVGRLAVAAPVHRDLHLRQLILGDGRVWLLDWDLFACGDPALDVGNLAVSMRARLGEGADMAVSAFLAGYVQGGGGLAMARVPLYMAFTYLRLACKRARLQAAGWREAALALIDRGQAALRESLAVEGPARSPSSNQEIRCASDPHRPCDQ